MNDIIKLLLDTSSESLSILRNQVSNIRYGEPGKILFEFQNKTYCVKEPNDVMPANDNKGNNSEASRSWALKQILCIIY